MNKPMNEIELKSLGDYQLEKKLGGGFEGAVFLATKNGKKYAIKTPYIDESRRSETIDRFRMESYALARVRHASLPSIYEIGEDQGVPFIVMEYLDGKTLDEKLEAEKALNTDSVVKIGISVASALAEVHRFYLVHRDIKPQNIMIGQDGSAKLIDFGMISDRETAEIDRENQVVLGTLQYTSPEQAGVIKMRVDGRSDLYSLGVTLYQVATGLLPFRSQEISELLREHATQIPETPLHFKQDLDKVLAAIILKLLSKDPDDRYQSARGLIYDLENLDTIRKQPLEKGQFRLGEKDSSLGSDESPLYGRDAEMKQLRASLDGSLNGQSQPVLIDAESGMGKSKLVRELIQTVAGKRLLVFQAKCSEQNRTSPFVNLRDAINGFVKTMERSREDSGRVKEVFLKASQGVEGALLRTAPNLSSWLGIQPTEQELQRVLGPDQLVTQLTDFFVTLSRQSAGVIIYIDDIQWADELTLLFVSEFLSKVSSARIQFLLTLRSEHRSDFEANKISNTILNLKNLTFVKLGALGNEGVLNLLLGILGDRQISPELVTKLATYSNGNPLLLQEMTLSLIDSGDLKLEGNKWIINATAGSNLKLSGDVFGIITSRLARLDRKEYDILQVAALIGSSFRADLLARVLDSGVDDIKMSLDTCLKYNFVEMDHGSKNYRFFHDKIRESISRDLEKSTIQNIYRKIIKSYGDALPTDLSEICDLARYHRESDWETTPEASFRANLNAGTLLIENYAFDAAGEVLEFCLVASSKFEISKADQYKVRVSLGTAYLNKGRYDEATQHFSQAHKFASSDFEIANLEFLECRALTGVGQLVEAFDKMKVCLSHLNVAFPERLSSSVPLLVFNLVRVLIKYVIPERSRKHQASNMSRSDLNRRKLVAQVFETGFFIAYLTGRQLDMMQITFLQYFNALPLGESKEVGQAHTSLALTWALAAVKPLMNWHLTRAKAIGFKLQDPGLTAFVKAQTAFCLEFSGSTLESERASLDALPDVQRYLGSFMASQVMVELGGQYLNRWKAREAVNWLLSKLSEIDKTNNYCLMANARGIIYSEGLVLGGIPNLPQIYQEWVNLAQRVPSAKYSQIAFPGNKICAMVDQENFGLDFEQAVQEFYKIGLEDHHFKIPHCMIAHARFAQFERAQTPEQKKTARKQLKKAMLGLMFRATIPLWKCHLEVIEGGLARIERKYSKATKCLNQAAKLAKEAGSDIVEFLVARERARLERAQGHLDKMQLEAKWALELATKNGYANRVKQICSEFDLQLQPSELLQSRTTILKSGRSGEISLNQKRILDSLLQVNLATATTIDPNGQIRAVIDEILKVFSAERGFVFTQEDQSEALVFRVGRDSQKNELTIPTGYSSTIVKKVAEDRRAMVITGSDQISELGSKSAVIHDLRSMMAAPLFLREKFIGLIYIDSRVSQGLFTEDDISVLSAIANHIAIALESTRQAALEAARREMEKDLEISAAVQKMLLPPESFIEESAFELSSFYQPATKCGGDWWWYKKTNDGLLVFVGDVTGHGAGAAMITASIATAFRIFQKEVGLSSLVSMFERINEDFIQFANGAYFMTGMAVFLDAKNRQARWWSLGGPQIVQVRQDGETNYIGLSGSPMGMADFQISTGEFEVQTGDHFFILTDGIIEMQTKAKRTLRPGELTKMMKHFATQPMKSLPESIGAKLKEVAGNELQNDDYTMVSLLII